MTNLQSAGVQNEMRVQLAFIAGRPHVEFCGTSRADASEADISALFDKAKALLPGLGGGVVLQILLQSHQSVGMTAVDNLFAL